MAEKLQNIIELSEALTIGLSEDVGRWRNYLEAAARLYKYPFAEQLLIYGQRPDATACASTKIWNTRMGRWVNQYARGIALLDDSGQKTRLKYVFDISDTHPGRYRPKRPYIWQLKDFQQELITETLLQSFGEVGMEFEAITQTMQRICGEVNRVEQFAQEPAIEKLLAIAALVTEDNHLDYADELYQIKAESSLELLDEKTLKERFVRLLFYSVGYTVLSRCDLKPEQYLGEELFTDLSLFNTFDTMMVLGSATSDLSKTILLEIGRTMANLELGQKFANKLETRYAEAITSEQRTLESEKEEKTDDGIDLHAEREVSVPEPRFAGARDAAFGQIRKNEKVLSETKPQGDLQPAVVIRPVRRPSAGNRADGPEAVGADDGRDEQSLSGERSVKGSQPNGMGGTDEQSPSNGGGNNSSGADLRLEGTPYQEADSGELPAFFDEVATVLPQEKGASQQLSLFDAIESNAAEKHSNVVSLMPNVQLSQQIIDEVSTISAQQEGTYSYPALAEKILSLYKEYEELAGDQMEESDAELLEIRKERLHDPLQRGELSEELRVFSTHLAPEERLADELAQVAEVLHAMSEEAPIFRHNFRITDMSLGHGGAKEKYRANVAAIRLLKQIESENRWATETEQEILSRYVGWGSLPMAFEEANAAWREEYRELKALFTEEEYAAARATTLNAHYTNPVIIKAIYQAIENLGFQTGNLLEPACGIGIFFGLLPDTMADARLYGVELEPISGKIARQLYQTVNISICGFEETAYPDNFFDVAVGNVPFGQYQVADKRYDKLKFSIHDYFFAKTLDLVRPGGIIALITSRYTMDKQKTDVRRYLAQRAELLGAIRLPNTAFKANAGTEVVADILFLQKRDHVVEMEPDWVQLAETEEGFPINRYFVEHPEMVLGKLVMESTQYGKEACTCVPFLEVSLEELLEKAVQNIKGTFLEADSYDFNRELEEEWIPAEPEVRNFSYTIVDAQVYYRENSRMYPAAISVTAAERVKGMIAIRDSVRALIDMQLGSATDEQIKEQQRALNKLYDTFTNRYGLLNSRANMTAFREDSAYPLLCSLEHLDENGRLKRKADLFFKRTIQPNIPITQVETASEALAVSLAEKACVDLPYMVSLMKQTSIEEVIQNLEGVIFKNPLSGQESTVGWEPSDEYLSGNVRQKLKIAELAAEQEPRYQTNVEALKKVQPEELSAAEIEVRLGTTWIPPEMIQQFMYELLHTSLLAQKNIKVLFLKQTAEWKITHKTWDRNNVQANSTYGTERANAYRILEDTLNLRDVRIFDYVEDSDGKKKAVLNKNETIIAQGKQEQMKQAFADWIWQDAGRRSQLVRLYNELFNSNRPREYDGSHIRFVGMNPEIKLRPHQKNAIARILYGGNTLLAHVVGAGKSATRS